MTLDSAGTAAQADTLLGLVNEFIDVDPVSCFLSRFREESVRVLFIVSVIKEHFRFFECFSNTAKDLAPDRITDKDTDRGGSGTSRSGFPVLERPEYTQIRMCVPFKDKFRRSADIQTRVGQTAAGISITLFLSG